LLNALLQRYAFKIYSFIAEQDPNSSCRTQTHLNTESNPHTGTGSQNTSFSAFN